MVRRLEIRRGAGEKTLAACMGLAALDFGLQLWRHGATATLLPPLGVLALGAALLPRLARARSELALLDQAHREDVERGRAEVERERQARALFLERVGAELRDPLAAMLIPLEAARKGELGPSGLERMRVNAYRLSRRLEALLDLSQASTGQLELKPVRGNVSRLLREWGKSVSTRAADSGIALLMDGIGPVPDTLFDVDRIESVIGQLLQSAMAATPQGGAVTLRSGLEGAMLRVEVTEGGAEADAGAEADPFDAGLGLAMAKAVAERHGGRVRAVPGAKKGSGRTFVLELPATYPEDATGADVARPLRGQDLELEDQQRELRVDASNELVIRKAQHRADRLKLLVVEDNDDLRTMLVGSLGTEYHVLEAVNGRHGLEQALRHRPDLILSDSVMPELGGLKLCLKVRAAPELTAVPFVLLSVRGDLEFRLSALNSGADEVLAKPFAEEELLARIRNLLALQTMRKSIERSRANKFEQVKLASLGQMASGLAHEINTPLATLQIASNRLRQALGQKPLDEALSAKLCDHMITSVSRVSAIVTGLHLFSREGSIDPLKPEPVAQIVTDTLNLCQVRFNDLGIDVAFDVSEGGSKPSPVALCRGSDLARALMHLLNNAADAVAGLQKKWIRISASESGGKVQVAVTDSGSGIPGSVRRRLFEPFFTTKPEGQGMGLGLSVSKGMIEASGGTLSYDDKSPQTRFVIELPAGRA